MFGQEDMWYNKYDVLVKAIEKALRELEPLCVVEETAAKACNDLNTALSIAEKIQAW